MPLTRAEFGFSLDFLRVNRAKTCSRKTQWLKPDFLALWCDYFCWSRTLFKVRSIFKFPIRSLKSIIPACLRKMILAAPEEALSWDFQHRPWRWPAAWDMAPLRHRPLLT